MPTACCDATSAGLSATPSPQNHSTVSSPKLPGARNSQDKIFVSLISLVEYKGITIVLRLLKV